MGVVTSTMEHAIVFKVIMVIYVTQPAPAGAVVIMESAKTMGHATATMDSLETIAALNAASETVGRQLGGCTDNATRLEAAYVTPTGAVPTAIVTMQAPAAGGGSASIIREFADVNRNFKGHAAKCATT